MKRRLALFIGTENDSHNRVVGQFEIRVIELTQNAVFREVRRAVVGRMTPMLTFMQLKVSKAKRKLTQKQRAQIVDIDVARKFVRQAIEEALAVRRHIPEGLFGGDLERIFTNQPVHFDGMGYVPHWFERQDIKSWGNQICQERYRSEYEAKEAAATKDKLQS
jgi:hypothetical protein